MNLPRRPRLEQLRKRAKDLQRAVRSRRPAALELVARHAPEHCGDPDHFTLATAQLVIARRHGFASWPRLREHLAARRDVSAGERRRGARTVEDIYRTRTGWAAAGDMRRIAGAVTPVHPDPDGWLPLFTVRHNGVTVIAFETSAGAVFAELTPRRVTLSPPTGTVVPPSGGASVTFHTALGTIAGAAAPRVDRVDVAHPTDPFLIGRALVAGGVFVAPNAFRVGATGLVLRIGGRPDEAVPASALPPRATAVVDRPTPAAQGAHATGLAAALAAADAPPVVDPDQWRPGAAADLTPTEHVRLARYGRLLLWRTEGGGEAANAPSVHDFAPQRGPVRGFTVVGEEFAATRLYYGFVDGGSHTVAVVGLVDDGRVASFVLRRDGMPDLAAHIAGGTFLIAAPDLTDVRERGPVTATLVTSDSAGNVRAEVPYQREPTAG